MASGKTTFLLVLVLGAGAAAQEFESWQDAVDSGCTLTRVREAAADAHPRRTRAQARAPLVRFGAGASYLVALRPSDLAAGDRVLSEFSLSLSPWRAVFEIGADLALGRDDRFFARPNLKLLLVNRLDVSFYLEGHLALFSQESGLEVGWGGGLGASAGLMENLALEVVCATMVFWLLPQAAEGLIGPGLKSISDSEKSLVVFPYAGIRLSARF